jgi:hypothetical protein
MAVFRRMGLAAATMAAVASAAVVLTATPAAAAASGCVIPLGGSWCVTGSISPNAQGQIMLTAIPAGSVTCRAYDAVSGHQVGPAVSATWVSRSRIIGGLTNRYYAACNGAGWAGGSVSN